MINIYQQGGQMNDEQKAFTAYLIKILNPTDERDFEAKVSQLSEDDIKKYYKQFKTMEVSVAKLGAKLNYIQSLRGECPEGYEVEKFMAGGCVKCKKKANQGGAVDVFKNKCGGMAKKRVKKNMGGTVSNDWSIAKNQQGGKTPYKKLSVEDKGKADLKADSASYSKAYPKSDLAKKFNRENNPKKRITKKN